MGKHYVALKRRLDICTRIPGYTTEFYELIEDIPRYHRVKVNTLVNAKKIEYESQISKQSTFNIMDISEKKRNSLTLRVRHLNWGIITMLEELRDIHDKEILRITDRDDSTTPQKIKEMLRIGKKAYDENLKLLKEHGHYP